MANYLVNSPPFSEHRIQVQRRVSFLVLLCIFAQLPLVLVANNEMRTAIVSNVAIAIVLLCFATFMSRKKTFYLARRLLIAGFTGFICVSAILWQENYQTHWFLLLGIFVVTYLFDNREVTQLYCCYLLFSALFLGYEIVFQTTELLLTNPIAFANAIFMLISSILLSLNIRKIIGSHWRYLQKQSNISENIVARAFPKAFVPSSTNNHSQLARIESVSVLFIDMSCYTQFASRHTITQHVNFLHQVYSAFDKALCHYGIARIKTNGDQYIAATGIPLTKTEQDQMDVIQDSPSQQLAALCYAAIELQKAFYEISEEHMFNSKLKMGIAHGSVTAGFIGYLRPSFDLWGQPMITAARLEQFCPPGTLLMCERAKKLLNESNLHCDYFGKISNKDQTLINTFQLHTIKQPSSRTQ